MNKNNLIYLNNEEIKIEKTKEKNEKRKLNIGKIVGIVLLSLLILAGIVIYIVYANNEDVRAYIDKNILLKEVEEDNLNKILISDYDKSTIFAYQNKILILNGNKLHQYNTSAKEESSIDINISTPVYSINGEFFAIAEKNGNKLYMIKNGKIEWNVEVEGQIENIKVNEAGYTAVIVTGTTSKFVISLYNEIGEELFKSHLSRTTAIDVTVSKDNKYLAYAEINTNGNMIQSNIKVIDIEKAKTEPTEGFAYTYKADSGSLILKVEYQNNNNLVCLYDDNISVIQNNQNEQILNYLNDYNNVSFISIDFSNSSVIIEEASGNLLTSKSKIRFISTTKGKESLYNFDGVAKNIYISKNRMAISLGSEIHFIDSNGWLIKKYYANQEPSNVVISDKIAGIIYRDKIEIVKL